MRREMAVRAIIGCIRPKYVIFGKLGRHPQLKHCSVVDRWPRLRPPDENIRAIRVLQAAASSETRAHFAIEPDGSFLLDILMLEMTAG
jgi:hypothetical protein